MENSLLTDIIAFKNNLKTRQMYLINTAGMPRANDEMLASSAETLDQLLQELDVLIAKHLVDNNLHLPSTEALVRRERKRRESLFLWGNI